MLNEVCNNMLNESKELNLISEYYFGRNPYLDIIEAGFRKIKEICLSNRLGYLVTRRKEGEIIEEIEKATEDLFGFKTVFLDFMYSGTGAVTVFPINYVKNFKAIYKPVTTLGKYNSPMYTSEQNISAFISMDTSIFQTADMDEKEATAIYLHEIGHNFYSTNQIGYSLTIARDTIWMINHISNKEKISKELFKYLKFISIDTVAGGTTFTNMIKELKKNQLFEFLTYMQGFFFIYMRYNNIAKFLANLFLRFKSIEKTISEFLDILIKGTKFAFSNPAVVVSSIVSKDMEKFSDSFATSFGYGGHLSTALLKTSKIGPSEGAMKLIFEGNPIYDLFSIPFRIVDIFIGSHPDKASRIYDQIKMIEFELSKKDMNPKLKKELQEQLDISKQAFEEIKKYKMQKNDYSYFSNLLSCIIAHVLMTLNPINNLKNYDWMQHQFSHLNKKKNKVRRHNVFLLSI